MFTRAALSEDLETRRRAEQYVIDQLADQIQDQADLDRVLGAVPDPEQRFIVLDALKPLLKFEPRPVQDDDLTIYHAARETRTRKDFHDKAEAESFVEK